MNEKFLIPFKIIYHKFPILQPYMGYIHRTFFQYKTRFSGWGMKTAHDLPWNDEYKEDIFRKASVDIKKNFEFGKNTTGINRSNIDTLLWRHWIVSYTVRHAIKFSDTKEYNFVECGVGDGTSAFFALREIKGERKISKFSMHLYDSWKQMRKEGLLESELSLAGKYSNLNIEIPKRNLAEFKENIVYHQGYIPESFNVLPESPNSIIYLHIDLNSAKATQDALNFFFPRLVRGGVILFDDYGWIEYNDTKRIIDVFFSNKPGMILKLPTGQAIYFHR